MNEFVFVETAQTKEGRHYLTARMQHYGVFICRLDESEKDLNGGAFSRFTTKVHQIGFAPFEVKFQHTAGNWHEWSRSRFEWIDACLDGRWSMLYYPETVSRCQMGFLFELSTDATMFKLRW